MSGAGRHRPTLGGGLVAVVLLLVAAAYYAPRLWQEVRDAGLHRRFRAVVLVSIDTLNINFTGSYNGAPYTPNLDRLASAGVLFEHAYTTVPLTLPSHTTMMSGRSPESTGVMANGDVVPLELATLAEILHERGYATAAFPALGVLKPQFGLAQGFDHYDVWERFDPYRRTYRRADEVVQAAEEWIRATHPRPFFVWVHLSDPHEPYQPREPPDDVELRLGTEVLGRFPLASKKKFRLAATLPPGGHRLAWRSLRPTRADDKPATALALDRLEVSSGGAHLETPDVSADQPLGKEGEEWGFTLANEEEEPKLIEILFAGKIRRPPLSEVHENYSQEVSLADSGIGKLLALLDELGLGQSTLVTVVSDHGEGLYGHGTLGHASVTWEDQLEIAWLMRGPRLPGGVRVEAGPVLMQDVLPTLLDVLSLPAPEGLEGQSRTSCFESTSKPCRTYRTWRAYGLNESKRIVSIARYLWPFKGMWRRRGYVAVYDLSTDPNEFDRLKPDAIRDEAARDLGERAEAELEELQRVFEGRAGEAAIDDETRDMLRSLGYL